MSANHHTWAKKKTIEDMTHATTPTSGYNVTRDPYVLLTVCQTFHESTPEFRKAIKECVDARPSVEAPVPQIAELQKDAERWRTIEHAMRYVGLQTCGPPCPEQSFDPRQVESLQRLREFVDTALKNKREVLLAAIADKEGK